ncbi:MAG: HEAT repeat domain-containing protein [Anaerolineae bacterium]
MSEGLTSFLELLADERRPVRSLNLAQLSDLTRSQLGTFRAAWDALSPTRRLELISHMVEQAEANIHLNFHAILRTCLGDADARVRRLAIEGLWEDEKTNLIQPLIDLLNGDPAAEVRAAAAMSLGRYVLLGVLGEIAEAPARLAEAALQAVWNRFGEPVEVRRRVLESLAFSTNPALREMIRDAYYDEDDLMRQSAIFAMGRSADARWARYILAELDSHEPAMRFESAVAAGEIGLREAVQPLIRRLDDPDSGVREAAATALGKIGGPAARRALEDLLQSPDEALAAAAEDALDELAFNSQELPNLMMDYRPRDRRTKVRVISDVDEAEDELASFFDDDLAADDGDLEAGEADGSAWDDEEWDEEEWEDEDWDDEEEDWR